MEQNRIHKTVDKEEARKKQHRFLRAMENLRSRFHPVDPNAGATIFLTGADVVGYRVATRLIEAGSKVRVGIASDQANSQASHDLKKRGVSLVPFSWEDESTYSEAVQGAKMVFCVVSPHKGCVKRFHAFFDACRKNGVEHFVKLSFYNALASTRMYVMKGFNIAHRVDNPFCHVPLIKMHGDCDEMIIKSHTMDYTILFVTHLMSDPAVNQRHNIMSDAPKFYSASAGKGVNYVSPNDIAAAAVRVLVNPKDHRRVGYTLTGPTHITDTEVVDLLSKDLNKTVEYVDVAPKDYGSFCCSYTSGISITDNTTVDLTNTEAKNLDLVAEESYEKKRSNPSQCCMDDLVQLEKLKATGIEVKFFSKDFEKLCGRPAETFRQYLDAKSEMTPAELLI
jgi:NAD(P)H dehydrogenase (quinone)